LKSWNLDAVFRLKETLVFVAANFELPPATTEFHIIGRLDCEVSRHLRPYALKSPSSDTDVSEPVASPVTVTSPGFRALLEVRCLRFAFWKFAMTATAVMAKLSTSPWESVKYAPRVFLSQTPPVSSYQANA